MTPFIGSIDADKGDELIISRDYQGTPSADKKKSQQSRDWMIRWNVSIRCPSNP